MSGIYGVFRRDGAAVDLRVLSAMQHGMLEWGPDSQDSWVGGNFATGFVLMRNTPESFFERQPILAEVSEQKIVISADARIDNRDELCNFFNIGSSEAAITPDSELVKLAYLKWGESYPKYLVGAYAIAIWNCKSQRLHLTRDYMGFRPLYIFENSEVVVFASEVDVILRSGEVMRSLDQEAVRAARAQYTPFLRNHSLIENIKKVLPAHSLTIDLRSTLKHEYWSLGECEKVHFGSDAEYADAMRKHFLQAVQSSVRSAFPIGSHLSGGLDSSAVTVVASRCLQNTGHKLEGVFAWSPSPSTEDFPLKDERARIEEVCENEGVYCNYSSLSIDDIIQVWLADMSLRPQDTLYNEIAVRREARNMGVRTMLSGWGGDEFATFSGRGVLCELLWRLQFRALLREIRLQHKVNGTSYKSLVIQQIVVPLLPTWLYALKRNLLPSELQSDSQVSHSIKKYWRKSVVRGRCRSSMRRHHKNVVETGWLSYRIEGWAARSVGQAIDYRYPLLDRRLVEFCIGLPPEQFLKNGWPRYIFRKAVNGMVPDSICWGLDNKQEVAKHSATVPKLTEAVQKFTDMCKAGSIEFEGESCMWQDLLLSDFMHKMPNVSRLEKINAYKMRPGNQKVNTEMKDQKISVVVESPDAADAKLDWQTPELLELDFQRTEAGSGGFFEGTVGGIPVGTTS